MKLEFKCTTVFILRKKIEELLSLYLFIVIIGLQILKIISFKNVLNEDFEITNLNKLKYILGIIVTWNYAN